MTEECRNSCTVRLPSFLYNYLLLPWLPAMGKTTSIALRWWNSIPPSCAFLRFSLWYSTMGDLNNACNTLHYISNTFIIAEERRAWNAMLKRGVQAIPRMSYFYHSLHCKAHALIHLMIICAWCSCAYCAIAIHQIPPPFPIFFVWDET